jgi:hypothetical protein
MLVTAQRRVRAVDVRAVPAAGRVVPDHPTQKSLIAAGRFGVAGVHAPFTRPIFVANRGSIS